MASPAPRDGSGGGSSVASGSAPGGSSGAASTSNSVNAAAAAATAAVAASSSSNARCPNCIAKQEEVKLLKSELEESDNENQQLHETLSQLLAQNQTLARDKQQQDAKLDEKLKETHVLNEIIKDLNAQLRAARQEIDTLRNADAANTPRTAQITELQQEKARLEASQSHLQTQIDELAKQLVRESSAHSKAQAVIQQLNDSHQSKQDEFYAILKENELLRMEQDQNQDQMQQLMQETSELRQQLQRVQLELAKSQEMIRQQAIELCDCQQEMDLLHESKQEMETKLLEMDQQQEDAQLVQSKALQKRFDVEKAALLSQLQEYEQQLTALQQQLLQQQRSKTQPIGGVSPSRSDQTQSDDKEILERMENELTALQTKRLADQKTIYLLEQQLRQAHMDLETLANQFETQSKEHTTETTHESLHGDGPAMGLASSSSFVASDPSSQKLLQKRLQEQRALIQDMETHMSQLQHQLSDAQQTVARYEAKLGIEDVIREQKQIRQQLERQQKENQRLRQEINSRIEAMSRSQMAFDRLKQEAGKPKDFRYDDLEIEELCRSQQEVLQATIDQKDKQIDLLEQERVELLLKLRYTGNKMDTKPQESAKSTETVVSEPPVKSADTESATHLPTEAKAELEQPKQSSTCPPQQSVPASSLSTTREEEPLPSSHFKQLYEALQEENILLLKQIGVLKEAQQQQPHPEQDKESFLAAVKVEVERVTSKFEDQLRQFQQQQQSLLSQTTSHPRHRQVQGDDDSSDAGNLFDDIDVNGDCSVPVMPPDVSNTSSDNNTSIEVPVGLKEDLSAEKLAEAVANALEKKFRREFDEERKLQQQEKQQEEQLPKFTAMNRQQPSHAVTSSISSISSTAATVPLSPSVAGSSEQTVSSVMETSEEMDREAAVLNELHACLEELASALARNEQLEAIIKDFEGRLHDAMDHQVVLYRHLMQSQLRFDQEVQKLQHDNDALRTKQKDWELLQLRFEETMRLVQTTSDATGGNHLISVDVVAMSAQCSQQTKRLAELEVQEAQWNRQQSLLVSQVQHFKHHSQQVHEQAQEMEKLLKNRVLYLESWKKGAEETIGRMELALDRSVLRQELDDLQSKWQVLLQKHSVLWEEYTHLHVKYMALQNANGTSSACSSTSQIAQLMHQNHVLQAQVDGLQAVLHARTGSSTGGGSAGSSKSPATVCTVDAVLQKRIQELESELATQQQKILELESKKLQALTQSIGVSAEGVPPAENVEAVASGGAPSKELNQENELLYERVMELEQLYEHLARECTKYKETAALAASQAHFMSLAQHQREELQSVEVYEARLRELASQSEDNALVGSLQQQLMQIKHSYQQFALKYDKAIEQTQLFQLQAKQVEFDLENQALELAQTREKARESIASLRKALDQVANHDLLARIAKFEAFTKRIKALEEDFEAEKDLRRKLERELQEQRDEKSNPLLGMFATVTAPVASSSCLQGDVGRLKSRIEALEARERVLLNQLEVAGGNFSAKRQEEEALLMEAQESKQLAEDLMVQLQTAQKRIAELLAHKAEIEVIQRDLVRQRDQLEMDLQLQQDALNEAAQAAKGSSSTPASPSKSGSGGGNASPTMRKRIGLYEQDQAELQQAAQATIASLKLLVQEKNSLLDEYKRQMQELQNHLQQEKVNLQQEYQTKNKQLTEENQRNVEQLREALAKLQQVESQEGSSKALTAARELQATTLNQLKQATKELVRQSQTIEQLRDERESLTNQRDTAEARAGEVLEELVLLKEDKSNLQHEIKTMHKQEEQLKREIQSLQKEISTKASQMQLLKDAIIKLKEEFFKAEERHAMEAAHAQFAQKPRAAPSEDALERERKDHEETCQRLEKQVEMLKAKLQLMLKENKQLKKRIQQHNKDQGDEDSETASNKGPEVSSSQRSGKHAPEEAALHEEMERLKRALKEKIIELSRMEELQKRVSVLEAQNLALREASASGAGEGRNNQEEERTAGTTHGISRQQWETEKKLERRVEILRQRLSEKQKEAELTSQQLVETQQKLKQLEETHQRMMTRQQTDASPQEQQQVSSRSRMFSSASLEQLQRQLDAFLVQFQSERRQFEQQFVQQLQTMRFQMDRMVTRVEKTLQVSAPALGATAGTGGAGDPAATTTKPSSSLKLEQEEQAFLLQKFLEEELKKTLSHTLTMENDLLKRDTRVMELELEAKALELANEQLTRKLQRMTKNATTTRSPAASPSPSPPKHQQVLQLEQVIENMKRVIEKLRSDNDKLRNQVPLVQRASKAMEKYKKIKQENASLEQALQALHQEMDTTKSQLGKLQQQHRQLTHKYKTLKETLQSSDASSKLRQDDLDKLQTLQLEEKNARIAQLEKLVRAQQQHPKRESADAASGHDIGEMQQLLEVKDRQLEQVTRANEQLKKELAAFDLEFFEEIEDLKYKYAQALKEKSALEKMLRNATKADL